MRSSTAFSRIAGLILMQSPKIAKQWEKGVVLRLGKFVGLRGPGLFWIVPLIDSVSLWIEPSTAVESMGMGGFLGAAALRQEKLTGEDSTAGVE